MSEEKEYRKKPVVIKAYQTDREMEIETLEGTMRADVGDFIVTGVQGEQYPVKPDIFMETYDLVDEEEKTIEDWYTEWNTLINELSDKEIDLANIKETYDEKEFEIVFLDKETDFKALYGSTSEKVRKQHASIKLQPLKDAKTDLEISINYLKRRIDFIRSIMSMQKTLLEVEEWDNID